MASETEKVKELLETAKSMIREAGFVTETVKTNMTMMISQVEHCCTNMANGLEKICDTLQDILNRQEGGE